MMTLDVHSDQKSTLMNRMVLVRALVVTLSLAATLAATGHAHAVTADPRVDVNGDGREDQLISHPGGGQLLVRLASAGGSSTWQRVSLGVVAGYSDSASVAACDFDGDGFTDVAVGLPSRPTPSGTVTGGVATYRGTSSGLASRVTITQGTPGIPGVSEAGDEWGASVACGRVGSDPYADLVVGAPGEDLDDLDDAGAAVLIRGGSGGLDTNSAMSITQSTEGVGDEPEDNDRFASAVAVGDLTGDGLAEIVIGALQDNLYAGVVHSLKGSTTGWTPTGSTTVTGAEVGGVNRFGGALAIGNFNGAGPAELAVGSYGTDFGGAVTILPGAATNVGPTGQVTVTQDTPGVPGVSELLDGWGLRALAAGDLTRDGRDELLVGAHREAVGLIASAGSVTVLLGSGSGLTAAGAQAFTQDTAGVPGSAEPFDEFGFAVTVTDVDADGDGDGDKDAVIGSAYETVGTVLNAGMVTLLDGSSAGLTTTGAVGITASTAGATVTSGGRLGAGVAG